MQQQYEYQQQQQTEDDQDADSASASSAADDQSPGHLIFKEVLVVDGVEVLLRAFEKSRPWRVELLLFEPNSDRECV